MRIKAIICLAHSSTPLLSVSDKEECSELEIDDVQPMFKLLKYDAQNPVIMSWVNLAEELEGFPDTEVEILKEMIAQGNTYSAADGLLGILKGENVTLGGFLEKLLEVDADDNMEACKDVIQQLEIDISKVVEKEMKKKKK